MSGSYFASYWWQCKGKVHIFVSLSRFKPLFVTYYTLLVDHSSNGNFCCNCGRNQLISNGWTNKSSHKLSVADFNGTLYFPFSEIYWLSTVFLIGQADLLCPLPKQYWKVICLPFLVNFPLQPISNSFFLLIFSLPDIFLNVGVSF